MSFHLYTINELYSNADGSIQFIELKVGSFNGQDLFQGHTVTATQGTTTHSYTFLADLPSSATANTSVLIATQGFADLGIVVPNYIVPSGFLFVGGGTVNFAGVDSVVYAALPTGGTLSINRSGTSGTNSPTNFAGATGTVSAPVNQPPVLNTALPDQSATEDTAFSFTVRADAFVDAGDTLSYSATKADGSALPTWLAFNAGTRTFSGTPANSDVGSLDASVTATDGSAASASDSFRITVANTNDAPTLANALADGTAIKDTAFSFSVPSNAFVDVDNADTLSYSATKADDTALPAWLSFNASTRTFSGTPGASDTGTIDIKVTATDASNAFATDVFALTVPGDTAYTLSGETYFWNKVAARTTDNIAAGHVLMDRVTVSVNDGGTAREGATATVGAYAIAGIAASSTAVTASLAVSTADKATVTLGDALEVLKLYLGKLSSPSPYKYLAADFNADNKVTLADALGILKSVLNKAGALEPAWVFVDEEANVSALTKDSATRPTVDAHPVGTDPTLNMVAVLRGDVNGSWKPAATASYEVLPDTHFTELVGLHTDYMTAGQFGL